MKKRHRQVALLLAIGAPLLGAGGLAVYHSWWWQGAEDALSAGIQAVASGQDPAGLVIRVEGDSTHNPSTDFRLPYERSEGDTYIAGMRIMAVLGPGAWVAQLRFANGRIYEFEVRRFRDDWYIHFYPAPFADRRWSEPVEASELSDVMAPGRA